MQQPERRGAARISVRADHRHERHHAGASADQLHRTVAVAAPDEPAARRTAHLEAVADLGHVDQVGGDLAVDQPVDGDLE